MKKVSVIEGQVASVPEVNIDTDRIIPARFLKRIERSGFGEFLFSDWAKEGGVDLEALKGKPILAAGGNFGCGSSREHAPWALQDFGFEAVVAPSFADIFRSNCAKIGLLAVELGEDQVNRVAEVGSARIDLEAQSVTVDGDDFGFEIDPETKRRLLEGLDDIGITLQQASDITAYEGSPLMNHFGPQIANL